MTFTLEYGLFPLTGSQTVQVVNILKINEKHDPEKKVPSVLYLSQGRIQPSGGGGGGGGVTLIFSYIRRLGSFLGFKILNFNIFGNFQIFFGVIIKLD